MTSYNSIDPSNMYKAIYDFPDQIREAVKIGESISLKNNYNNINNIVVAGMGGSAIGGDVTRLILQNQLNVPMYISRNYTLPNWVDNSTLVICSSYSGNTEESLASFKEAQIKKAKIIAISTGGILTKQVNELGLDIVTIPKGLQPRAALALSFVPMIYLFKSLKLIKTKTIVDLIGAINLIETKREIYNKKINENPAYSLSKNIYKSLPVIYGENESTAIIAVRWKGQLSENAKMLAYHNELPEMNHNEIVGWENNSDLINKISIIWLKDKNDHPRTTIRQTSTKEIIGNLAARHEIISVEGSTKVERYLNMIHLGDWVSFWCAILHGTDPTPVTKIDKLKEILSK
jgi:glucose/mannose-6-phosphate isomerase|tara:strand:+ start:154 stop:1194 length:1041 start_codon:yes stop_codon:yes gene_type:complete